MSFAYYTPKGCRFRGIPLTFSSLEPCSHVLSPGLGAGLAPRHERIISPAAFHEFFEKRASISALPAPARRGVHFGGAMVTFEEAQGRWGAHPVIVESPEGTRALVIDGWAAASLEGVDADELVVSRLSLTHRGAVGLQSTVDQLIFLRRDSGSQSTSKFRVAVQRLDIAWAILEGLRARGESACFSGSWSRARAPDSEAGSDGRFHLCPVDGHLRRLKVDAFVSSALAPLGQEQVGIRPHYVVRDTATLDEFRALFERMGRPRVVGPANLLSSLEKAGLSLSTTVTQGSFDW